MPDKNYHLSPFGKVIEKKERRYYPLSHSQKRELSKENACPGTSAGNMPFTVIMRGDIRFELLEKAINISISKNDALRLRILKVNNDYMQYADDYHEKFFDFFDFSSGDGRRRYDKWLSDKTNKPFSIIDDDLFYFALIKISGDDGGFFINVHSLICDRSGISKIIDEIIKTYYDLEDGLSIDDRKNPSYLDCIKNEADYLVSDKFKDDKDFWKNKFEEKPEDILLPYNKTKGHNIISSSATFNIDEDLSDYIDSFCSNYKTSFFKLFNCSVFIYLSRILRTSDIITAIRTDHKINGKDIIGNFANILPLRMLIKDDITFSELLSEFECELNVLVQNRYRYPYDMLLKDLKDIHGNIPDLLNISLEENLSSSKYANITFHRPEYEYPPYHLRIKILSDSSDNIKKINYIFPKGMYDDNDIKRINDHIISILKNGINNPLIKVLDIDYLSMEEKTLLLHGLSGKVKEYPEDKTIIEHFQECADHYPDNTAIVYKDKKLTYKELNEKANQIGCYLRNQGIKPEDIVGIMAEPSLEMIIGIFGILKSGGAYVPIDPAFPDNRIKYILEDSKCPAILSHKPLLDRLKGHSVKTLDMEDESLFEDLPKENLGILIKPENLVYLIYTSGSTGNPKGVMIENKSLINLVFDQKDSWDFKPFDRASKFAGFAFDASVFEIFAPLISGSSLYIIEKDLRMSPRHLSEYFNKEKLSKAFLPTQFAEQFIELSKDNSLEIICTGGDKLRNFKPVPFKFINAYGPTEYTVCTSTFTVDRYYDNIPIGKPISNTKVYILDKNLNLMPFGSYGELCVSGKSMARGYLNRPDLTSEKFIDNPFEPGQKLYKTGDLARWLPDGNLEFKGRIDFQVKVRGYRIELGEIEKELLKSEQIKDCIVLAIGDEDSKSLCAYIVSDSEIDEKKLKDSLRENLPEYMIPTFFVYLDKMPINPSGKIDRKALPEPELDAIEIVPPEDIIEEKLLDMYKDILSLEKISTTESFFAMGGHSLKANILQLKIENVFNIELSFNDIFKNPSIKQLAEYIRSAQKKDLSHIRIADERDYYPITSAQKRLYITDSMKGIGLTYNIPLVLEINGYLDTSRFIEAFDNIVRRHDSLRTSFISINGEPYQKIDKELKYKKNTREIQEKDLDSTIKDFIKPFDLSRTPLFRIELLKVSDNKHYFLMDIHHTVFDGSSMVIFIKELSDFYCGKEIEPLTIQYKDYSCWQDEMRASESLKKQEKYWMETFNTLPPSLDMPTDYPRPGIIQHDGNKIIMEIDEYLTERLNKFALDNDATLYMVIMASLNVLYAKYSGNEDIVIGSYSAGRNKKELINLIGMFVNTLPIRNYPSDTKKFNNFLKEVRQNVLDAFENQDFQFEDLIERLNIPRDPSRLPMLDIGLVFQSMGFPKIKLNDLTLKPHAYYHQIAHMDIMLEVVEDEDKLHLMWEYRTSLYKEETIRRMAMHFKNILLSIIEKPDALIKDINILSQYEIKELVHDLNKTDADYPENMTVHEIFEQTAEKFPDRTAIVYEDRILTYTQLNQKANQFAHYLRQKGVKANTIVGIMLDKCPEMIIGLIGIIKSGACYLPMKPNFPQDRINYILENSNAPFLITSKQYLIKAENYKGEIIDIEDENIKLCNTDNPVSVNNPEDLIYIIYTSGSTGRPKGVMLEHRNVVRLFKNSTYNTPEYYNIDENDIWTMFHSFCFDFSVWELYGAILYGGKVIVVSDKLAINPKEFLNLLKKEKVTVLSQTPGAFYNLIEEDLKSDDRDLALRYVTFGGEELKPAMLEKWHNKYPETRLINMYGITETTVHSTYKEITDKDIKAKISNIGSPIPTMHIYIMDRNLNLVPKGFPGEICEGGPGIARGYLGLPDMTDLKFVDNPYREGERIYRSGDLARMLPNGEMEYLGRIDFQVKIRGFRIELGEIENQLLKHDFINKAVVIAREDEQKNKYLASYLIMEKDKDLTIPELREFLQKELPDYMVPSYFIKLDMMPLTPNGKVDRKLLPDPVDKIETGVEFVASRSDTEEKIIKAWQKVLGIEKISVLDNFFDLGGHSLKAVSLIAELQHDFEVSVNDIFEYQTVSNLAKNIKLREDNLKSRLNKLKEVLITEISEHKTKKSRDKKKLKEYSKKNEQYNNLDYSLQNNYKNILLTGATGYLGIYILKELLDKQKCKVHLIIRGENNEASVNRIKEKLSYYFGSGFYKKYSKRILVYAGDLGEEDLGIIKKDYDKLAERIDAIIHPAAIVKHYGNYEEFYHSNVKSVENLLNFAKKNKQKHFHHISTLSVVDGPVEDKGHITFTEYDLDLGQRSENYYVKTKFEAEKIVFEARNEGLVTNIYRVGNISINSETGQLQDNIDENAFFIQIKAFVNIGAVPEQEDEVEFSFVDYLSKAIVMLSDRSELKNEIFHLMNSNIIKLSKILSSDKLNLNIDTLPLPDFIDYLSENYDREGFQKHIQSIMLHRGWLSKLTELTEKQTSFTLVSDKTNLILENIGFKWPGLKIEALNNMIIKALEEKIHFLKEVPLFKGLSDNALDFVSRFARLDYYDRDKDVLWEGEQNDKFYIIIDGHAEVSKIARSGWHGTIGVLSIGDFFGEQNIWNNNPSPVTVEAILKDLRLYSFNAPDILKIMSRYPTFSINLSRAISNKLKNLQFIMVNLG